MQLRKSDHASAILPLPALPPMLLPPLHMTFSPVVILSIDMFCRLESIQDKEACYMCGCNAVVPTFLAPGTDFDVARDRGGWWSSSRSLAPLHSTTPSYQCPSLSLHNSSPFKAFPQCPHFPFTPHIKAPLYSVAPFTVM